MKLALLLVCLAFAALPLTGQTPTASPVDERGSAPFGSSLKKYENKDWREQDEGVVRVDASLVVNNVLVKGPNGDPITTLKKEDFAIAEDGEPQDIDVFFNSKDKPSPRSIVLMIGNGTAFELPNLERNIRAAKLLIDDLGPEDRVAIVTTDLKLRANFTNDKTLLESALDSIAQEKKWVSTTTLASLMAILNEKSAEANGRPIIVVQGAMSEIFAVKTGDDSLWNSRPFAQRFVKRYLVFTDIENAVMASNVTIYNVVTTPQILGRPHKEQVKTAYSLIREYGNFVVQHSKFSPAQFGVSRESWLSRLQKMLESDAIKLFSEHQRAMTRLADISGGTSYFVENPEDADTAYRKISEGTKSRYTIGYYPKGQDSRGKIRRVSITIKGHPEYTVTTRPSYVR